MSSPRASTTVPFPAGHISRELMHAVHHALWAEREPGRAAGQRRYMKSSMPFMGIRAPVMRRTARAVFNRHRPGIPGDWMATILALWREARYREHRYAAVELVLHPPCIRWLTMDAIAMVDELVVDGGWWDYVDRIAPAGLGHLLAAEPEPAGALLRAWARDNDIWRRRAAILSQIKRKEDTDPALLYDCLEPCLDHPAFFVQKAMGWALRAWARTDPGAVRRYVVGNEARLSKLARREALENIGLENIGLEDIG